MDRTRNRVAGMSVIHAMVFAAGTALALPVHGQPEQDGRDPEENAESDVLPPEATGGEAVPATIRPPGTAQPSQPGSRQPTRPVDPADGQGAAAPRGGLNDDEIELTAFSEPVELTTLVDYAARALGINISIKTGLTGSVVFNAPVKVPRSRLLALLDALLEQQGHTITYDPASQFYSVHPTGEVPVALVDGMAATTRVFATPNVRPSALKVAIDAQLGSGGGVPGSPQQGIPGMRQYAYVDELGVIVATDSPRKLAQVESLITRLLSEHAKTRFIRIELNYVAAPVARERALQLVGQASGRQGSPQEQMINLQLQQQGLGAGLGSRGTFDNLADRLTIDPQGNALIFRGLPEEVVQVQAVLDVIDVPSKLLPRKHEVGRSARPIAEIARQRGLGEVTQIADTRSQDPNNPLGIAGGGLTFQDPSVPSQGQRTSTLGGPVMVVDETRGLIVYYGTESQQAALKALVDELRTDDDRVVFRNYKLKNARADDVAQLILGVINNQTPVLSSASGAEDGSGTGGSGSRGSSGLLGDMTGGASSRRSAFRPTASGSPEDGLSIESAEDIFIVADQSHNQLIVKAPIRDQESLARLISKLDLRRPQVYIEAKIIVVNWSDQLRLAFETQLINAGGSGGVLNTNFGLSSFGTGSTFTDPKTVNVNLAGLTAAIIKSDQVPIVMNALQTEVEGRLLSTPQVLVDDNTQATIDSKDEQPTTTTTIGSGGNPNTTTFNEYVEAGTKLIVTPTISEGGYIRLDYEINLSSFTGESSAGVPPPKQTNTLKAKSVTVPSDSTVVLGGLTFDSETTRSSGIPILKDIPILGLLFQDLNKTKRKTTLYVFLTPRIMRDPNFADLRLAQEGPRSAVGIEDDMPTLAPTYIDSFEPRRSTEEPPR